MNIKLKNAFWFVPGLLLLSGCLIGPKYIKPDVKPPQDFVNTNEFVKPGDTILNLKWFQLFGDSVLIQLIDSALANNYDLKIALARIQQAEAIYGIIRADQYPAFNITGNASRTDYTDIPIADAPVNDFSGVANVSWEMDLWGRVRHAKRGAFDDYLATIEAQKTIHATLISDVASLYFQLRDLDNKIAISERTAETRRESYRILSEQFDMGYVAQLDVFQVEQLLRDAEASIPAFIRQRAVVEHSINILLGQNTTVVSRGFENIAQPLPPQIPSGLPSTLLEHRPDVKLAEFAYMAENERIGVAMALRLPLISLTGFLGIASPDISELLTGDALVWEAAGGIFAPIFNFGKNQRRVDAQVKQAEIAMYEYRKSFITALAEVEDALIACENLKLETAARDLQAEAARQALNLSQSRYDNGYTSYLEVLDAQRSLFSSELAASTAHQLRLNAYVQLYKALGGGW